MKIKYGDLRKIILRFISLLMLIVLNNLNLKTKTLWKNLIIYGVIAVAIIVIAIVLINIYVKAPPSYAYILSGIRKEPRVMIGTGGFKIPFLERWIKCFLVRFRWT